MTIVEKEKFIEQIASGIVERRMSAPAILFLEILKPLCCIGNQVLFFLDPLLKLFTEINDYEKYTQLLENRENLEMLIKKIEENDEQHKYG